METCGAYSAPPLLQLQLDAAIWNQYNEQQKVTAEKRDLRQILLRVPEARCSFSSAQEGLD